MSLLSIEDLKKVGLAESEARVYVFLLEREFAKIAEIVSGVGIPRSSVYQYLEKLKKLGLIEEIIEQGMRKIKAYPIGFLRHELEERKGQVENQMRLIEKLEKKQEKQKNDDRDQIQVKYYSGVSGARQVLWNSLSAKDVVLVYSAYGRSKYVGKKYYADFVAESRSRGIKEKVLVNPTHRTLKMILNTHDQSLARTSPGDIRYLERKVVKIEGETFLYNNTCGVVYLSGKRIVGFEIESEAYTRSQKSIFDTLWDMASGVENAKHSK